MTIGLCAPLLSLDTRPLIPIRVQQRNVLPGYDGLRSRRSIVPQNANWYQVFPVWPQFSQSICVQGRKQAQHTLQTRELPATPGQF
jgi:hypothetical protein